MPSCLYSLIEAFDSDHITRRKKMYSKRIFKSILAIALVAIILSACSPAAPSPVATNVPTKAPVATEAQAVTQAPATQAPTQVAKPSGKIVVWGWSYDVFQTPGLIDAFKQEYPDVDVEIVTYKSGDTYQNFQLAVTAGQGAPDVVQLENSHLAQFVNMGGLADISERVAPYLDKENKFKWVDAQKDGKYYAMPWDSGPVVTYYRRDVFKAAGLSDDPKEVDKMVSTWDGYLDVCKTIKEKTGKNCFSLSKANNDARLYEIALWQQGLGYYDVNGKVTVDSPENVATLEKLGDFWKAGVTSEEQAWTDPWYAELSSKDSSVASIVEASWLGVFLKSWIAGDTSGLWGVARMPAFKDGEPRAANDGGSTLAIPEQSQNKEAAWAFIEFMLGRDDNVLKSFAYSDFLPALETTYNSVIFSEADPFFGGQFARQIYLETAKIIPEAHIYGPNYVLMNGYVATAIQKYATGQMSAADALKEAADSIRRDTGG
jgi:ABC-type glycerol-3-phosphate transport system substrate-binding protein